jgi:aryl-alcohol dehydrogenase-like predicted oxidoreductase
MANKLSDSVALGKSDVRVSPVGMGAWAWGARMTWGEYLEKDVRAAFDTALIGGITLVDTAEIYGMGVSERLVGEMPTDWRGKITVATKFAPFPWRISKGQLGRAADGSRERLKVKQLDLYQIHFPYSLMPVAMWVNALADAVEAGKVKLAGVSNYSVNQTRAAHEILKSRGLHLTSNQIHYSLLYRQWEKNGLLDVCRELGVTVIAYSPIEMGMLSGKYTPQNPPPGRRGMRYGAPYLTKIQPLIALLREIGQGHPDGSGGKSAAQVAINWTVAKGTLPIPGARNEKQAAEIVGTLGWQLSKEEVSALDAASDKVI